MGLLYSIIIILYNSSNECFLIGVQIDIVFLSSFLNNNCFQFENAKTFSSKNLITGMYLHLGVVYEKQEKGKTDNYVRNILTQASIPMLISFLVLRIPKSKLGLLDV